jgi:hypothetical protein
MIGIGFLIGVTVGIGIDAKTYNFLTREPMEIYWVANARKEVIYSFGDNDIKGPPMPLMGKSREEFEADGVIGLYRSTKERGQE